MTQADPAKKTGAQKTVVFADVCKSTRLFETHGDARARALVAKSLGVIETAGKDRHGTTIKTIGDAIMMVFDDPADACEAMRQGQSAINCQTELVEEDIHMRIGVHTGELIEEHGDVFGDSVNVASRLSDLALPDQIAASESTVAGAGLDVPDDLNDLGKFWVKGKSEQLQVFNVLWRDNCEQSSTMFQEAVPEEFLTRKVLQLRFGDRNLEVSNKQLTVSMGRGETNDLTVNSGWVSRQHAQVLFRNGGYVFVDRSTNGTYIQMRGQYTYRVHRDELQLHDAGKISLGRPVENNPDDVIDFEIVVTTGTSTSAN